LYAPKRFDSLEIDFGLFGNTYHFLEMAACVHTPTMRMCMDHVSPNRIAQRDESNCRSIMISSLILDIACDCEICDLIRYIGDPCQSQAHYRMPKVLGAVASNIAGDYGI
jgi:hypothetical protein